MNPAVTFVVPCYKLAHLLPECVSSILVQTFEDFEVLIMDDCSPDNTPEVAQSFNDPRIKYIRNEPNLGHLKNYNKGIGLAKGKYVWLVSADDRLRRSYALEHYVEMMERYPNVGFVCSPAVELYHGSETGLAKYSILNDRDTVFRGDKFLCTLLYTNVVIASSGMVRKACYEKQGAFPLDLPFAGDWYLWCLFALHHDVGYLAEPLVNYRGHDLSMTNTLKHRDVRILVEDELATLWRMKRKAEESGKRRVANICERGLAYRYASFLTADNYLNYRMEEKDLEESIVRYSQNSRERNSVRASAYMSVGDIHFRIREFELAETFYDRALKEKPSLMRAWLKRGSLTMGNLGILIRERRRKILTSRGLNFVSKIQVCDGVGGNKEDVCLVPFEVSSERSAKNAFGHRKKESAETKNSETLVLVSETTGYGGAERHLLELVDVLRDTGVDPLILRVNKGPFSERIVETQNVRFVQCEKRPRSFLDWFRLFRKVGPDILVFVHGNITCFGWREYLAGKMSGARKICSIQHLIPSLLPERVAPNSIWGIARLLFGWRTRYLIQRKLVASLTDVTICVSNAVRNSVVREHMYSPSKTASIPNGVNLQQFAPSSENRAKVRGQLGIDPSAVVLICCARLDRSKGVDILLEALGTLIGSGKTCQCIVVGEGLLRNSLEQQVIRLGLAQHVHFEGFKDDVRPYLQAADIFALTSHQEGMPLAVLEAMACGLPCVVTDVGGTSEAVGHMNEGLLVKPGSVEDVQKALAYLLDHEDERIRMARQAFAKSRDAFDVFARMREIGCRLLN